MKRAILYARVSTDEQADKGYSLPSQFEAMRKYAAQQGFEVVAEFQDDFSGATPIEYRPSGSKAYAMLKSGAGDVIIAYTVDRFVRPPEDGDEWDMPVLIRGLAKLGKEIHTVRRGKLNTNFADLLIALLDARKAGEERRDIIERVTRGKRAKAKSGKVTGNRPPYGYRHLRDQDGRVLNFEVVESEARVVRLIFKWYVQGEEHHIRLSAVAVAKRLSEMRLPTPGELRKGYHRKRDTGMWHACKIIEIISHEVYAGVWWYGGRIGATRKRRPQEDQIAVKVPAIVDREIWERAQLQRVRNKATAKRNKKRDYLLSGLMRCGCERARCGEFLSNHRYYDCAWRQNHHSHIEERVCWARRVRADAIEADVWDEILELFQDLDRLWSDLKAAQQAEDGQLEHLHEKLSALGDFIHHAEREVDKTAKALRDAERGGAVYLSLKRDEQEINARIIDLNKQRHKIAAKLEERKLTDENIETIMDYARNVRAGIDNATFEDKVRILESLDVRVIVTEGKYHIDCILGSTDGEIRKLPKGVKDGIVPSSY